MALARDTAVRILREKGGEMSLVDLSKELYERGSLGFGVETIDIVNVLHEKKIVSFNMETEIIRLEPSQMSLM